MRYQGASSLILALAAAACGGTAEPLPNIPMKRPDQTPPIEEPVQKTVRPLVLDPSASAVSVVVTDREGAAALDLGTTEAEMALLFVDGRVAPSAISIRIGDVALAQQDLRLTDIHGELDFDNFTLEGDSTFHATANLRVTWSLTNKDKLLPIRPLELGGIEVHGVVLIDAFDRAHFALDTFVPGVVFDAAGLAQLSDLSVALTFAEAEAL